MKDFPDGKHKKMEKYILRKAFDVVDDPYLPEEVLWRQKEQFSDGVGYSWVDGLRDYAESVSTLLPQAERHTAMRMTQPSSASTRRTSNLPAAFHNA